MKIIATIYSWWQTTLFGIPPSSASLNSSKICHIGFIDMAYFTAIYIGVKNAIKTSSTWHILLLSSVWKKSHRWFFITRISKKMYVPSFIHKISPMYVLVPSKHWVTYHITITLRTLSTITIPCYYDFSSLEQYPL